MFCVFFLLLCSCLLGGVLDKRDLPSNGSCFSETGGKHSVYINPHSETELSRAITKVQSDEDFRKNMIKKGYIHTKKFTDEKVASNLMEVYKSL